MQELLQQAKLGLPGARWKPLGLQGLLHAKCPPFWVILEPLRDDACTVRVRNGARGAQDFSCCVVWNRDLSHYLRHVVTDMRAACDLMLTAPAAQAAQAHEGDTP